MEVENRFLDLPEPLLVEVSRRLSCKDLASLLCASKKLAAQERHFFTARTELDMREFAWVGPSLFDQILARFQGASLQRIFFSVGLFKFESLWSQDGNVRLKTEERYTPDIESQVLSRFPTQLLDLGRSERLLVNLLYGRGVPRPMDILVHGMLLERMLQCHGHAVREVHLDCEASVRFWPLAEELQESLIVSRNCPNLESYHVRSRYVRLEKDSLSERADAVADFLLSCPRLQIFSKVVSLDSVSLPLLLTHLPDCPSLQEAHVHVAPMVDDKECHISVEKIAHRISKIRILHVTFDRLSSFSLIGHFVKQMKNLQTLSLSMKAPLIAYGNLAASVEIQPFARVPETFGSLPPTLTQLRLGGIQEPDLLGLLAEKFRTLPENLSRLEIDHVVWAEAYGWSEREESLKRAIVEFHETSPYPLEVHLQFGGKRRSRSAW